MPTYEYECTNCGQVFEMVQSITAPAKRKPDEPCGKCGKRAPIRRLISGGGAVLFRGTGFYQTDYRSESYKKAAESEKKTVGDKPAGEGSGSGGATKPAETKSAPEKSSAGKSVETSAA
jgi:putative FmdB family regulatory protein